ncbi:SMI1/KNR4 family protein [Pseudalkalibacillus hwajinpoensis]|uniref:SMI1/KNR4 family protein n=1 Tax=Guptibacillus hwajinpoensis TaxID=208199 RepID=UPI003851510A
MMIRKNNELSNSLKEIFKYADGVHVLNPGVNLNHIIEVEKELAITFPKIYKNFLQVCNGGELFIPGSILSDLYHPDLGVIKRARHTLTNHSVIG